MTLQISYEMLLTRTGVVNPHGIHRHGPAIGPGRRHFDEVAAGDRRRTRIGHVDRDEETVVDTARRLCVQPNTPMSFRSMPWAASNSVGQSQLPVPAS